MDINASTELYCIFGNPVKHSLSPLIHNAALDELGENAVYLAFSPESAREAVNAMRTLDIKGASVTIPFKTEIIQYIDEIDPAARMIGAVNTLKNNNGKVFGYNTDGTGALLAITSLGINIRNQRVLVLGNGGSARAVAFTLAQKGASVIISGRNEIKIHDLSEEIKSNSFKSEFKLIDKLDKEFMRDVDIVINTTPLGMHPDTETTPLAEKLILPGHTVFDIVYAPQKTRLLREAERKQAATLGGIEMLINQGLEQLRIWTGMEPPSELVRTIIKNKLDENK